MHFIKILKKISEIVSPVSRTPTRKRTIRYIGDIKSTDLESPKTAKLYFQMAKAKIEKQRKVIKTLKKTIIKLQNKVSTYGSQFKSLHESNLINMIFI